MPLIKEPDTEPIPGYRLIEYLGRGGFGQVWKCEAPGGLFKAIKFVSGNLDPVSLERLQAEQEWTALQLVKDIRHPFLLGMDRLELVEGELVVVMELADSNLQAMLRECREAGLAGIPREELLSYLREAAEALDVLNLQHGLQHLDVKPANLFLLNHHVKVGDYGLMNRLTEARDADPEKSLGGLTPLYCAPETLGGTVSRYTDQYSLAIVYQELLTGRVPFSGATPREVMQRHLMGNPELTALPGSDRPVVARALALVPEHRYPSCTEFVRALAPELMPARASPFLDVLLNEGTVSAPGTRSRTAAAPASPDATVCVRRKPVPAPGPGMGGLQATTIPTAPREFELPSKGYAGYHFEKCLTRGQLAELWKVTDPEGQPRLLKFPAGVNDNGHAEENEAIRFLEALRHPGLLRVQAVRNGTGRIAFVSAPVEGTLADRLKYCKKLGLCGIPRRELLDYLHSAALALDNLFRESRLQHLFLNPRTLLIDGHELLIADVGLAQLFWLPAGQPVGPLNGLYAAPELLAGTPSPTADQFSLAVIFQEMLTGTSPFRGSAARDRGRPNLDLLPACDRDPIGRALLAEPEKRFPSCQALIDALDEGAAAAVGRRRTASLLAPVIATPARVRLAPDPLPAPIEVVTQMLDHAAGSMRLQQIDALRYVLEPGSHLRHNCGAHLSPTLARLKLDGFRQHWGAELIHEAHNAFVFHVPLAGSFWQRCLGRQPAAEICLHLEPPAGESNELTAIHVEFRPLRCDPDQAAAFLTKAAPQLLHSLRTFLHVEPERRRSGRLSFDHAVGLFPVLEEAVGEALVWPGRDLSLGGIGLLAESVPPSPFVYVQCLLSAHLAAVAVLGRVVRSVRQPDGRFDLGILFAQGPETLLRAEMSHVRTQPIRPIRPE